MGLRPRDVDVSSRRNAESGSAIQPGSLDPRGRLTPLVDRAAPARGWSVRVRAGRWSQPQLVPDLAKSHTDADGRRPNVHVRSSPWDPLLERRDRCSRRFPPGHRAGLQSQTTLAFTGARRRRGLHEQPRTCDLSQGIETDDGRGGTITFNLVEPDPGFLYKLTTPMPIRFHPPSRMQNRCVLAYPAPGPMLGSPDDCRRDYAGSQPALPGMVPCRPTRWIRGPDRVDVRGLLPRIRSRPWPQAMPISRTTRLNRISSTGSSYGSRPRSIRLKGHRRNSSCSIPSHLPSMTSTVRRAMNRGHRSRPGRADLRRGSRGPTCQQLPPNFPGYEPYCPYTSTPGLGGRGRGPPQTIEEAREVVRRSGTAGMRVVFEYPRRLVLRADLGDYMVDLLRKSDMTAALDPSRSEQLRWSPE